MNMPAVAFIATQHHLPNKTQLLCSKILPHPFELTYSMWIFFVYNLHVSLPNKYCKYHKQEEGICAATVWWHNYL